MWNLPAGRCCDAWQSGPGTTDRAPGSLEAPGSCRLAAASAMGARFGELRIPQALGSGCNRACTTLEGHSNPEAFPHPPSALTRTSTHLPRGHPAAKLVKTSFCVTEENLPYLSPQICL